MMNRVRPGQPLKIKAATFNTFIEVAQKVLSGGWNGSGASSNGMYQRLHIVQVLNNTGGDLDQYAVVALGDPAIVPADNEPEFANNLVIKAEPADETSKAIAVLAEPLRDGVIGRAYAGGIFPCKVIVEDEGDEWAAVNDGGKLESGSRGIARIIWKESGTGEKWAVIHLGIIEHAEGVLFRVNLDQDGGADGDGDGPATWTYTASTLDDVELGTGLSPDRPRDSYGQRVAATKGTGYYDANGTFVLAEAWETIPTTDCEDEE